MSTDERHSSLEDRFDPAVCIVDYDAAWPGSPRRSVIASGRRLHVCEAGSEHEFRHVAVRDFLRAHDEEAARYEALKRRVAGRHPQDRLAYIEGKSAYVAALERRAVRWARERG